MDRQKLLILLKQDEGPKLDYKERLEVATESGKKELAKDIIALANSPGGRGYLIIGIQDKTKRIVGIDPTDYKEETIQQIVSLRADPPLTLRAENVAIDGKYVCVVTIFRSFKKPHQMRQTGAFYLRRGSTTDTATRDEIAAMLQSNGIVSNEQIPLFNMSLDVFDPVLIRDYLRKINLEGQEKNLPLLNNLGIIHYDRDSGDYFPTVGGMLMFSDCPQLYLPHSGIKLVNKLSDKTITLHFKGNMMQMLDELTVYLRSLRRPYPVEALEECLINAIIHRDYFDTGRDTQITLGTTKVVISNPGTIIGGETIDTVSREENPRRRNNWLYHAFLMVDDQKRLLKVSTGMSSIKKNFVGKERVRFINIKRSNLFKVVLPGFSAFSDGTKAGQDRKNESGEVEKHGLD